MGLLHAVYSIRIYRRVTFLKNSIDSFFSSPVYYLHMEESSLRIIKEIFMNEIKHVNEIKRYPSSLRS